jgi:deoxycytidylate deaminase
MTASVTPVTPTRRVDATQQPASGQVAQPAPVAQGAAGILADKLESELVIGLVGAVGTESEVVVNLLKERLGRAGYRAITVKISRDVIPLLCNVPAYGSDHHQRISSLMEAGDIAREQTGKDEILALGAATIIKALRGAPDAPVAMEKTAIIIDSLKRPEEVEHLRLIYPAGFILIGIHCEESQRLRRLTSDLGIPEDKARALIQRDINEADRDHGQRVNDTFHLADFFVRIGDNLTRLRADIKRMVELWFGNPFVTPTFDEHAMFMAFAAALRSADLSRQVGAVVTRDSQILATGANECPKSGGGLYWPTRQADACIGDVPRGRDYMRADGDSNVAEQNQIIDLIVQKGVERYKMKEADLRELLRSSRIRDLTEFGRVVHAEMEALLSCARNGLSTVGATLYCTTFPCHNCAKHIIAAGIEKVVYVEPYPKSKTFDFHDDAITTSLPLDGKKLVRFVPFVGIGPRRFFDLFSMNLGSTYKLVRKDRETGKRKEWTIEKAHLRVQMKPASYLELEAQACTEFGKLKKNGVKP